MGLYTEHWQLHQRNSRRNALRLILFLVVGLPATAVLAHFFGVVTGRDPDPVQIGLVGAWLVVFIVGVVRSTRIVCPRCATTYGQGKWQRGCPSCKLPILQEEP